jgi:surface antigen
VGWRSIALWGGLLLVSCLPAMASSGGNCVAYARETTGIHLDGNAASWWPHAEGRYERGHRPSLGAILVFKPYGGMHVGHVAVVSQVVGPREILVDQANWVRGRVTKSMSVVDASPLNDWTSVKVQYAGTHGRENPTFGFIYPRVVPASFEEAIVEPRRTEPSHAAHNERSAGKATRDEHRHEQKEPLQAAKAKEKHRQGHEETQQVDASASDKHRHGRAEVTKAETAKARDKDRREHSDAAEANAGNTARRVTADEPAHHKHKATDAKLAYVY